MKANNFVLFVALLVYGAVVSGVEPVSSYPFLLLLGLLLLFPLSGDPLAKIPAARLGVWPLTRRQRFLLRVASLAISPILWMVMAASLKLGASSAILAVPLVVQSQVGQISGLRGAGFKLALPGRFEKLVRKNVRQMFSVLDTYLAILIGLAGLGYRLLARDPDRAAFPMLAMLAALALSTYAQCLFSLDGESGATRYRLLPLKGWQVLAAKDAAFVGVLLVLTLPLDVRAGTAFGLTALAAGRYPAITRTISAGRWRFTSGRVFFGAAQIVLGAAAGFSAAAFWPVILSGYLASLYWGGKRLVIQG
jgi:hypothetical protein